MSLSSTYNIGGSFRRKYLLNYLINYYYTSKIAEVTTTAEKEEEFQANRGDTGPRTKKKQIFYVFLKTKGI